MSNRDTTTKGVAVITGAASGIGCEISRKMVELGYLVHGIDIREIKTPSVIGHFCDVSNPDNVMKTVGDIVGEKALHLCEYYEGEWEPSNMREREWVLSHYPPVIDVLINAAGVFKKGNIFFNYWGTNSQWEKVMRVNLNGTYYMSKYIFPWIKPGGCVINFSSEQVRKPNAFSSPYAVSKAAVEMLTRIMAIRGAYDDLRIRVNTIALGTVRTDFIKNSGLVKTDEELKKKTEIIAEDMPLGIIETEDVWNMVKYLLFEGIKITGQTILMDSGVTCNDWRFVHNED